MFLSIFDYSAKKLSTLESFQASRILILVENKIPFISTEIFRLVINLAKKFLQTQSFFAVWNQKQIIFILGGTRSRERKLLKFKRSSKIFTQDTKAIWSSIYPLYPSVISICSILWYELISTKRNPWVAVYLQIPINYWNNTSTFPLTLQSCYKSLGILWMVRYF